MSEELYYNRWSQDLKLFFKSKVLTGKDIASFSLAEDTVLQKNLFDNNEKKVFILCLEL